MRAFVSYFEAEDFLRKSQIVVGSIVKRRGTTSLRLVLSTYIEKNSEGYYVPQFAHISLNMTSAKKIANVDDFIIAILLRGAV